MGAASMSGDDMAAMKAELVDPSLAVDGDPVRRIVGDGHAAAGARPALGSDDGTVTHILGVTVPTVPVRRGGEDTRKSKRSTIVRLCTRFLNGHCPSRDRGDGSGQDKNPSRRMKEAVCQRVDFQPGNGVHRVAAYVADHVVPLKDLVKHNAVNEAPKTQAVQQTGHLRRRLTNHPRRNRTAIGHGGTLPSHALAQTRPRRENSNCTTKPHHNSTAALYGSVERSVTRTPAVVTPSNYLRH